MTENQKNLRIAFREYNSWEDKELENYTEHIVWSGHGAYKEGNLAKNIPKEMTLEYLGYDRGRSALNIRWADRETKTIYYSSMNLLDQALKYEEIVAGNMIGGTFIFKKQGTSILLERYEINK